MSDSAPTPPERDALIAEMKSAALDAVRLYDSGLISGTFAEILRRVFGQAVTQLRADAEQIVALERFEAEHNERLSRIAELIGLAPYGGAYDPDHVLPRLRLRLYPLQTRL